MRKTDFRRQAQFGWGRVNRGWIWGLVLSGWCLVLGTLYFVSLLGGYLFFEDVRADYVP